MNSPSDPMAEIRASFFVECEELLEALQDGLAAMEDGTHDAETINVVFRAVHSIKGGAGAFGLDALVQFAHQFETVLDALRSGDLRVELAVLKQCFQASDYLSDLVAACRNGDALADDGNAALVQALAALVGGEAGDAQAEVAFQPVAIDLGGAAEPDAAPDSRTQYDIYFRPFPDLFETGNEPAIVLACLQELGEMAVRCDVSAVPPIDQLTPEIPHMAWHITLRADVQEAEVHSVFEFVEGLCQLEISRVGEDAGPVAPDQPVAPQDAASRADTTGDLAPSAPPADTPAPTAPAASGPAPNAVVRVDLERVERLVNLVGELVINQAMLSQSLEHANLSPHSDAMNGLEEFQRLTRDIQDSVMMIRAQPVKSLFQRMSRIVREASSAVGKDVRLRTEGDTTEMDKTVIERLADPLTHMIRNAVSHGLEDSATRAHLGKVAQGEVRLSAAHRSGRVVIEVADDGGGIDRARVLQIAKDKGLVAHDAMLSDAEIDSLLFLPGFSTASEVSDLSGRGVGMDVVRTEIQALGGRISIHSVPQEGTRITISLPLTLAVLDGMVIAVAGQTLVLPLTMVIETLTLGADDVQKVRPDAPVIQVRGEFLSVVDLGAKLGYREALVDFDGTIALLVQHENGARAALIVDDILDQRQVVIKGLNDSLFRAPGVAAATILGDGKIALILDPSDIISQTLRPATIPPPVSTAPLEGVHV